jgi:hypothetical protein
LVKVGGMLSIKNNILYIIYREYSGSWRTTD